MTSESIGLGRRSALLAGVVGAVLASYAGGVAALDWEYDDGSRLAWNTTLSVGSSWRSEAPNKRLYTMSDGSLIGKYTGNPLPGTAVPKGNGTAGNWAAGEATLNYGRYDRFSTPFKILTDLEYKKGRFGGLVRAKAWYDEATSDEKVLLGNQNNGFTGTRTLGPSLPYCFAGAARRRDVDRVDLVDALDEDALAPVDDLVAEAHLQVGAAEREAAVEVRVEQHDVRELLLVLEAVVGQRLRRPAVDAGR